MTARIDLVSLGSASERPAWTAGRAVACEPSPGPVHALIAGEVRRGEADAWLFWDAALGAPPEAGAVRALERPGDLWHAGLALGLSGAPALLDFVAPTWTFNRDPDPRADATSWRVSFRACLVRTEVLRWAAPDEGFETLDGMSLEWGLRCIRYGALPRTWPDALRAVPGAAARLTLADEMRIVGASHGARWAAWAAFRAAATGHARFEELADAWLAARGHGHVAPATPLHAPARTSAARSGAPSVSVLIPTLDRPAHLRTVLAQVRAQTVRPDQVIVIDQTPAERRDAELARDFADLPLMLITLDEAGQSSARNAGLVRARGDAILFIDDDDEIEPDLIARHLAHLETARADVSSGVAREPRSGPIPEAFTRARASDVFPTNNTLARREVLERSGLFDLAYDRGARADGDLGMRAYLAGAVMMLAPSISVLHHHAPRGGLRTHGARVVTYARSRRRLTLRHLPEVTEIYRGLRYFSPRQVRESLLQAAMGTMSAHDGGWRRAIKALVGIALMPHTLWLLRRRSARARAMLERYPVIPALSPRAP